MTSEKILSMKSGTFLKKSKISSIFLYFLFIFFEKLFRKSVWPICSLDRLPQNKLLQRYYRPPEVSYQIGFFVGKLKISMIFKKSCYFQPTKPNCQNKSQKAPNSLLESYVHVFYKNKKSWEKSFWEIIFRPTIFFDFFSKFHIFDFFEISYF